MVSAEAAEEDGWMRQGEEDGWMEGDQLSENILDGSSLDGLRGRGAASLISHPLKRG